MLLGKLSNEVVKVYLVKRQFIDYYSNYNTVSSIMTLVLYRFRKIEYRDMFNHRLHVIRAISE